jgi:acetylglutamate kinase
LRVGLGVRAERVGGLRVTDRETAEVVQMVLAGKINKGLVALMESFGRHAIGLSGMDGHMILARQLDPRLGFVGEIVDVDPMPIRAVLENGYIPIVSTLGCDKEGNVYNINADTAAAEIAGALKAEKLILLTDVDGVKLSPEEAEAVPVLTSSRVMELIGKKIIVIANLEPARITGVTSEGMLLATSNDKGTCKVVFVDERVPNGSSLH